MNSGYVPIDDGWTRDGYIAADEGLHDPLSFTYRPLTNSEFARMKAEVAAAAGATAMDRAEAGERKFAEWIAKKVKTWDLLNAGVHPVAITTDEVSRLQPLLFAKLLGVIQGTRPSDKNPIDESAEQKN